MARTGNKYDSVWSAKLVLLLVLVAVILLGYSTAAQAVDKDTKRSNEIEDNTFLDPFALTLISFSTVSTLGEEDGGPWNPRALVMIPYRGWKRSPVKPPWPPE